jgi:hypothetical protein
VDNTKIGKERGNTYGRNEETYIIVQNQDGKNINRELKNETIIKIFISNIPDPRQALCVYMVMTNY